MISTNQPTNQNTSPRRSETAFIELMAIVVKMNEDIIQFNHKLQEVAELYETEKKGWYPEV